MVLVSASQRFLLCLYNSCFHFSVHSSHVFDPRNFLCYSLFWFYLYSEGSSTIAFPSAPVVSDCPLLLTPDCNHCELQWSERRADVSKHKRALELVDRFIYRDWAACSQGGVVRTSLLSYSLNSSFNLGELKRKSCFTSKVPQTSHSQFLLKPGYTGCLYSNMWGTFNTLLSQLPFSLP